MGQVVAMENAIDRLVVDIKSHVHDAGRAETTCAKHQLRAGLLLIELRARIERGESGDTNWWKFFETKFTGHIKSRSYAEKLMRWAKSDNPDAAIEAEQERTRDAMRTIRARTGPRNVTPKQNQEDSDGIVEEALNLVRQMTDDQRKQFNTQYRRLYQ